MFCKYCGKQIDTGTMRCRACGRPVGPLAGGNGFWDLNGEAAAPAANDQALQELREQVNRLQTQVLRTAPPRKSILPLTATLLAAIGLGLGVFSYMRGTEMEKQITLQTEQSQQTLQQMEEQITQLEQQLEVAKTAVNAVHFQKQPGSSGTSVGKVSSDPYVENGVWLFEAAVEEKPFERYWAKVDDSGEEPEYIKISQCDEREYYKEITTTDKTFRLYAVGPIQEFHFGKYVFVVEDENGVAHYSQVAELRDADAGTVTVEETEQAAPNVQTVAPSPEPREDQGGGDG